MLLAAVMRPLCAQESILWNSDANAVNLTSSGAAMDGRFRFELGVFADGFAPGPDNLAEWSRNWRAAQRTSYVEANARFSARFVAADNAVPFTAGKEAYVWGFRGDSISGEWIMFRAPDWTWPDATGFLFHEWFAKDATPLIGDIGGGPALMRSAAVSGVAPPVTTWARWQGEQFVGEPLAGPNDDPDRDGLPNLLEFVFGQPPRQAGASPAMTVTLVEISGLKFLQMAIPRRIEHPAMLVVEVSGDLLTWHSGNAHTEVVEDEVAALVVRDKTPFEPPVTMRFMRLRASLP